ncbi:hypothetical protein Dimus_024406, partial [Dionaea muscipula]
MTSSPSAPPLPPVPRHHPPPPPPPSPPPSPPQPPPSHHQPPNAVLVEIIVFVDNLPDHVGWRELFSIFNSSGCILNIFISTNQSRSGSRFCFVRFNSEVAAGIAILNADGLKLKDKTLFVKRAAFARSGSVTCPRMEPSLGLERREMREGRLPQCREGITKVPTTFCCQSGGGSLLTFKDALQGTRTKASIGFEGSEGGVPPPIVITGTSHGIEQLQHSCVIEWSSGSCEGIHASSLFSDLGVEVKVVLLDSWLSIPGERCGLGASVFRFMQGARVLSFRSVGSGVRCSKLSLDQWKVESWMMVLEDGLTTRQLSREFHGAPGSSGSKNSGERPGFHDQLPEVAMADREAQCRFQGAPETTPADLDKAGGSIDSPPE